MSDFRLEVFYTVAKRLSFTKAAAALMISQPAVTKHIFELEQQYGTKLFDRQGNKIHLTTAGDLLLTHTEVLFEVYNRIDFDMHALGDQNEGALYVGYSGTATPYLIAPLLASFKQQFSGVALHLINGSAEKIECALLEQEIEFGIAEERLGRPGISYTELIGDELVLVCAARHPLAGRTALDPETLRAISFVWPEQDAGTLTLVNEALGGIGLHTADLQAEIQLGSTESVKLYVQHSQCMAFVSIHAVTNELKSGVLRVVAIAGLKISRNFYFIYPTGEPAGLPAVFLKYAKLFHIP